ncbi:hypothetical protein FB451DRAFT_1396396 [Mycena latifolia]|nr:hypothetical protein FB451DRAFT_1396396 [Mycena latifolia]
MKVAKSSTPKRLGRPPGTGHLQSARAMSTVSEDPPVPKRPVGRPPDLEFDVSIGKHTRQGIPAVIRSKHVLDAADSSTLHPMFTGVPSASTQLISEPVNVSLTGHASDTISSAGVSVASTLDDPEDILVPEGEDPNDDSALLNDGVGIGDDDEESDDESDEPDPANSSPPRPRRTARPLPHCLAARTDFLLFIATTSGMSFKQFSDAIRVRHLEQYDKLHVLYLSTLAKVKEMSQWRGKKFNSFLPFEDDSPNGYHGFFPSSQWLRGLFDKFIEMHGFDFDQAIALLCAMICAIDHSFKLAKHIEKLNGKQIFVTLLAVTNENGEISVCNLVATKSHSQFELALNRMRESLIRYGHDQPEIFYTDNMADKDFLERCFPSLREAVITVEKYSHLPFLEIPEEIRVRVLENIRDIDEVFRAVLQDIPDHKNGGNLVLFLDSEWSVEISDCGYVTGRGATAMLQIAYKNRIYVIQIGQMLAGGKLPLQLQNLLLNPRILKVGRTVSGDLKYLEEACQYKEPFGGAVDLPSSRRNASAWEGELSKSQIRYASVDVYACCCIYDFLVKTPDPSPLPDPVLLGTPILLFHDGHSRLIARGTVASLEGSYDTINITRTRCLIEVTEIIDPAAIITTHKRTSLIDFGPVPFKAVCLRSHLRLATELNLPSSAAPLAPPVPAESTSPPLLLSSGSEDKEPGLGVLLSQEFDSSKEEGSKDAFHIFNMFYISVVHSLRIEFARPLRDAIFIPDAADKARIITWRLSQSPPTDWDTLVRTSSQWLWRRCKRIIPPPEELYPLVAKVFEVFGHLKDAKTGLPLFNSAAWAVDQMFSN